MAAAGIDLLVLRELMGHANFVPAPDASSIIASELDDIRALGADAQVRDWPDEAARHARVAESLQTHLDRLRRHRGGPLT